MLFFFDENKRRINKLKKEVEKINKLESKYQDFSGQDFKKETERLKDRVANGSSLDEILPEAFALVREASKRAIGLRHFDVQLMGGMILHKGDIAEMRTGEGKTLVATLPAYLNALEGKGVHVVTVNDYLAKRDASWMGEVYDLLGLSVGCVVQEGSYIFQKPEENFEELDQKHDKEGSFKVAKEFLIPTQKKDAYQCDITYCTNNELGFDYLRDNMAYSKEELAMRDLHYAIIDEVDSILIDEARTPLIISAQAEDSAEFYYQFAKIIPHLQKDKDYVVDEKHKAVTLTEDGINKVERILGIENIYDTNSLGVSGLKYIHHLEQALRAEALFKKDRDYVVRNGEVIIVDEFTGRLMPGRRYSGGLHQAIEAKEGVLVQKETRTVASITFQNYFRLYKKISGMTGTAKTSEEEFFKVFGMKVVQVPPNKPSQREDLPDLVFKTQKGKYKAVIQKIKELNEKGRPVLVGTVSIEKNEYLSELLKREGIKHNLLNAKNHEQEGEIIAQAGQKGAVTVATNMAGRGVDIILGGSPFNQKKHDEVASLGGLFVIGTERHESRRIDNQLRGRAGRQGDPGASQFFLSLEDDLMRIFGGDKIKSVMNTLNLPEDQPIKNPFITKAIESAQKKVEGFNFDARRYVLEFDEVLNKQRDVIYKLRKNILFSDNPEKFILEFAKNSIERVVRQFTQEDYDEMWDVKSLCKEVSSIISQSDFSEERVSEVALEKGKTVEEKREAIIGYFLDIFKTKLEEKKLEFENFQNTERILILRTIDMIWMEHLESLDYLRDSVNLRAYGQKDPLIEFKREAHSMFSEITVQIERSVAESLLKISPKPMFDVNLNELKQSKSVDTKQKIGRNDPCPCGSGKKYKKCHGV